MRLRAWSDRDVWHEWYAWYPVRVGGWWVWFERVERIERWGAVIGFYWEYTNVR